VSHSCVHINPISLDYAIRAIRITAIIVVSRLNARLRQLPIISTRKINRDLRRMALANARDHYRDSDNRECTMKEKCGNEKRVITFCSYHRTLWEALDSLRPAFALRSAMTADDNINASNIWSKAIALSRCIDQRGIFSRTRFNRTSRNLTGIFSCSYLMLTETREDDSSDGRTIERYERTTQEHFSSKYRTV
jgi:hypothetical protein